MHLNMLPMQSRRRQVVINRGQQWSLVWGAALALLLIGGWLRIADCRRQSLELERLEAQYSRVKSTQDELVIAQNALQELEQREALVLQLSQRRPMLSLLGGLSQAAQQCDGTVSVRHLKWETKAGNVAALPAGHQPIVTLQGIGLNNLAVAQFASALRNVEILQDVQLKSTQQQVVNGNVAHGYQMECIVY